jgi:hypothetical protein
MRARQQLFRSSDRQNCQGSFDGFEAAPDLIAVHAQLTGAMGVFCWKLIYLAQIKAR